MSISVTVCVYVSKKCDAPQYCPVKIKLDRVVNYRICTYIYIYTIIYTLWLFNIAMENGPFIDDFPLKPPFIRNFPWLC